MSKSKIEWTEVTWNPVLGCAKVSEGCRNCYAMSMSARIANAAAVKDEQSPVEKGYMDIVKQDENGKYLPKWTGSVALIEERLEDPLNWQKPRVVFVNSMSDLFHPDLPFSFIDKVFAVMALTPHHTYQVLTKRPDRMAEYLFEGSRVDKRVIWNMSEISGRLVTQCSLKWPLPNVWLMTSVENQDAANERIIHLLNCPAAVRGLSMEPLLGPVNLNGLYVPPKYVSSDDGMGTHYSCLVEGVCVEEKIDWVIAGGESGHNARPMHPDWVRTLRDQCKNAGVPFFFKQWGNWAPLGDISGLSPDHLYPGKTKCHFFDDSVKVFKIGKKNAGNLLDGQTHNEYPNTLTP